MSRAPKSDLPRRLIAAGERLVKAAVRHSDELGSGYVPRDLALAERELKAAQADWDALKDDAGAKA